MFNYEELLQIFNNELNFEINNLKKREPKDLYEPVVYTLNMGGKRIRPVLLLMAFNLYDNQFSKAMPVAFALELFHNFTLLHDDIMDNAVLRRSNNTVHIEYSSNSAILSGDAMSILSYEYLAKCESENYREIFNLFTKTALQICEGQQYDMDFEKLNNVTVEEYLTMIGLKTAVLMAASLKLGALIAGASPTDCDLLYQFGYNLGMSFQLQDDLLDSFGETANFGKNIGGDIVANKKTYLMLKAYELAKDDLLVQLKQLTQNKTSDNNKKIKSVLNIYQTLGVESLTNQRIEEYYNSSIECLEMLSVEKNKKNAFEQMAEKLMSRIK